MSQRKLKKIRKSEKEIDMEIKLPIISWPSPWEIIKRNWKFLIVMLMLAFGLYINALRGDFVSDDYATILNNPEIGDFWSQLNHATFANSMNMSNWTINLFFGNTNPVPYHVFSLIVFMIFCVLGYVLAKVVTGNEWVARLTSLVFVTHPIHVEAVSWIAGRIYLLIAVYVLASVISFIYFVQTQKNKYLWWSIVFFGLAFCTDRPRPFSVFLIIGLYLLTIGKVKDFFKKYYKIILGAMILGMVALVISWPSIVYRINVVNSGYNASESIFYNPLFQYPTGFSKYLQLLFFPADLTLYHTMFVFPIWLNWAILITYVVLVGYFYFKNRPYFFALAFIFVAIFPSLSPIKVSWLVAERYMFLGSWGWCLFGGLIIWDIGKKIKYLAPVLLALVVSYSGVRLILRNNDWRTNHNLWVNTCQVSPNSHNAWNNIGDDYDKLKQYENSIKGFTQSTVVKPNYADAFHNRANIFFKIGRLDLARDSYNTALYFSPSLYQTYLSLVQIDLIEKKLDLALEQAQLALKLQPDNPQAAYVLAIVLSQRGENGKAEAVLQQVVTMYPQYTPAVQALSQIKSMPRSVGGSK